MPRFNTLILTDEELEILAALYAFAGLIHHGDTNAEDMESVGELITRQPEVVSALNHKLKEALAASAAAAEIH